MYKKNEDGERQKFETLSEAYETVKKTIMEYSSNIKILESKIPLTTKSLKEAMEQLELTQTNQRDLEIEKRQKWTNLENSRSSMQASRSRGRVLDSLMQQKLEGNCPGLFGRLVSRRIFKFYSRLTIYYIVLHIIVLNNVAESFIFVGLTMFICICNLFQM